jgi:outer membrane protein TolC
MRGTMNASPATRYRRNVTRHCRLQEPTKPVVRTILRQADRWLCRRLFAVVILVFCTGGARGAPAPPRTALVDLLASAEQHPRIDARQLRRVAEQTALDENLISFMPLFLMRGTAGQRTDPVLGPFYSHYMPTAAATGQTLNGELGVRGRAPFGTIYQLSAGGGLLATDDIAAALSLRFEPTIRLRLEQPLWRGMSPSVLLAPVAAAEARVSGEVATTRQAHFDILLSAAEGYLATARTESLAALRRRTLEFARQFEALTRELIEGGKLSMLDLAITVQTVSAREAEVSLAELDATRARVTLLNTLGIEHAASRVGSLEIDLDSVSTWPIPETDVDASLQLAIAYSPELALLQARLAELAARSTEAADTVRPNVRLVVDGAWGSVAGVNRCPDGYLADGITPCAVPAVYDGGLDSAVVNMGLRPLYQFQIGVEADVPTWTPPSTARERSLQQDRAAVDAEQRAVVRRLAWLVERNVMDVKRGQLLLEVSERAVTQARAALAAEQTKHRAGRSTGFDVLRAQDLLVQAEQGVVESRYQLALAIVRLRALRGELLPSNGGFFPLAELKPRTSEEAIAPPPLPEEQPANVLEDPTRKGAPPTRRGR